MYDNPRNILGDNSANNNYNSSSVVSNPDGSIIERLETIQQAVGGVDSASNPMGANNANNGYASNLVAANPDGSVLERLEEIQAQLSGTVGIAAWPAAAAPANGVSLAEGLRHIVETLIGALTNTGGTASLTGIIGDVANISMAARLDSATKKTSIADGTTIPNNAQAAAGLLATATNGDCLIEEIVWQRGADNFVGPTNYEFTTDNVNGLTGAAAPNVLALLAKFNAQKTGIASIDGATKQLPFVLESGKKLYIHGDDGATSAGGATDFYIKYRRLAANAYLA